MTHAQICDDYSFCSDPGMTIVEGNYGFGETIWGHSCVATTKNAQSFRCADLVLKRRACCRISLGAMLLSRADLLLLHVPTVRAATVNTPTRRHALAYPSPLSVAHTYCPCLSPHAPRPLHANLPRFSA